jgi:hypothetical protein
MERLKLSLLSLFFFIALLVSAKGLSSTSAALAQASPTPSSSPALQQPKRPLLLWFAGGVVLAVGAIGLYSYYRQGQQIQKMKHALNSLQAKHSQAQSERKLLEEERNHLKRNYSILENERNDLERKFSLVQSVNQQSSAPPVLEDTARNVPSTSQFLAAASPALSAMQRLLQAYQTNSKSLHLAAKVTEAPASIDQRRSNPSLAPNLVESGNFDYLIVQDQDNPNQYWLFPKSGLKVNQYAFETVQALFDCYNYQNQPSNFQVRKPASVTRNPASSSWQITEKGEIEFV